MIMDLDAKEERLRFLQSKIDNELSKFKDIKDRLDNKRKELSSAVDKIGASGSSISFFSESQENVLEYVNSHTLELENLRNYISSELKKVIKQKDLLEAMRKQYGDKVVVEQTQLGDFRIKYTDEDVDNAAQQTNLSKKLVQQLKESTLKNQNQE
jgi:hypothetical protein